MRQDRLLYNREQRSTLRPEFSTEIRKKSLSYRLLVVGCSINNNNTASNMAGAIPRRIGKLVPQNTCLLLCDMQEKFRNSIQYFPQIVEVSNRLLRAFKLLDLPVVCTEQYPKGLGSTVPELGVTEHDVPIFDKTKFSMCLPPVQEIIKDREVKAIVLCGIESHVCVQQTALDFLEAGLDVHLVVDACSSRSMVDRMYSFERMRDAGAFLTTSESVILGLAGGSCHPSFKALQKIIWESAPDTGLLAARQQPLVAAITDVCGPKL